MVDSLTFGLFIRLGITTDITNLNENEHLLWSYNDNDNSNNQLNINNTDWSNQNFSNKIH